MGTNSVLLIALTGNIASGKSTVAQDMAARGALVIDSDIAARSALAPGTPGLAAVIEMFGAEMLTTDGSLDRARLGRRVFADVEARRALEAIVHPAVEAARQHAVQVAREAGRQIVICDIPLLFEAHLVWQFPRVILVDAPAPVRIDRLVRDRGMSAHDAAVRVAAQMPAALKRFRSDLVIDNHADRPALSTRLGGVWTTVQRWVPVAGIDHAA
jgi:dephospho-CoA kinase